MSFVPVNTYCVHSFLPPCCSVLHSSIASARPTVRHKRRLGVRSLIGGRSIFPLNSLRIIAECKSFSCQSVSISDRITGMSSSRACMPLVNSQHEYCTEVGLISQASERRWWQNEQKELCL